MCLWPTVPLFHPILGQTRDLSPPFCLPEQKFERALRVENHERTHFVCSFGHLFCDRLLCLGSDVELARASGRYMYEERSECGTEHDCYNILIANNDFK